MAVRPIVQNQKDPKRQENSIHYGILMGGPRSIQWSGVGQFSVGHLNIPRRSLAEFTRLQVGHSFESAQALETDENYTKEWAINPDRVRAKSPQECARDVFEIFGRQGFIVPLSLIGVDFDEAVSRYNAVLPFQISEKPLVDVISHLESLGTDSGENHALREELLSGAYLCRNYLQEYTRAIKGELELAKGTGKGKRGLDVVDREYFWELREPLPELVPALTTMAMGEQIGKQFVEAAQNSKTEALLAAIVEQNKLQAEELKLLKNNLDSKPKETSKNDKKV